METDWGQKSSSHVTVSPSLKTMAERISFLNDVGYESFLQVYHNQLPDIWIKSARSLNVEEKIKFMIAVRPMSMSPEQCAMMCSAFNQIQPNRLMLNIVHGSFDTNENQDGTLVDNSVLNNPDLRKDYTKKFLDTLRNKTIFKSEWAEILVAGGSPETIAIAKNYGDFLVTSLDSFERDGAMLLDHPRPMLNAFVIVKQGDSPIYNSFKSIPNLIMGTQEEVLDKFNELYEVGFQEFLISTFFADPSPELTHQMVKNIQG